MELDEMYARMRHLYVYVCSMALGDYSREAEGYVAEYFELKALLKEWL